MNTEPIKCTVKGESLYIENVKPGTIIQVFNNKGNLYQQIISGKEPIKIFLDNSGMYLVVIQLQAEVATYKVMRP